MAGAAEQVVGQAGPGLGSPRAGLVADATSAAAALVSGGLLCLGAVAVPAVTTVDPGSGPRGRGGRRQARATDAGGRSVSLPGTGSEGSPPSATTRLSASTCTTFGRSVRASASSTCA
ncbi:protein of unknown function (plasmid) [Streptantibioticus cattleyicolor NRRL 8057 = DSM 46488]|nr:protein of unknown function [Streptantibioticus cattleyicolor NRRL 8057 = DSM 46488]